MEPLAQRLRPRTLNEVCGQQHLLGKNQVFRRTVESGKIPNKDKRKRPENLIIQEIDARSCNLRPSAGA